MNSWNGHKPKRYGVLLQMCYEASAEVRVVQKRFLSSNPKRNN
jgi:hypothetical protein